MSDAVQVEQNEPVTAKTPQSKPGQSSSDYRYEPGSTRPPEDELYSFRSAIAQHIEEEEAQPKKPKVNVVLVIGLVVMVAAIAALIVVAGSMWFKPKPANLYIDLGSQRYDPAGLGGRLIAQYADNASYKFTVDPLDPSQVPGFHATITNPPHAITFSLIMRDAKQGVACRKDIVIPGVPEGAGPFDPSQALAPRTIPTGDTWQNVAGDNGQIDEMVLSGSLPCNLNAYKKIVAWEFSTDFPPLSTQKDWEKHEDAVQAQARRGRSGDATRVNYGGYFLVRSLPAPIEADDVIVSDNPTKGVVATSSGRAFLVGSKVLVNPALDWQVFPANIHYRCDRTAMCMVTRLSSRTAVRAHLLK